MLSDLPFWTVVAQIIRHTPPYVWAILLALVALGALQWRDHTVSRTRLALAPIGLGAFSLWGATMAFGAHPTVVAAWLAGIGSRSPRIAGCAGRATCCRPRTAASRCAPARGR